LSEKCQAPYLLSHLSQIPCKRPQNNPVEQVRVSLKSTQEKLTFLTGVYKIAPNYVPSSLRYLEIKEFLEKLCVLRMEYTSLWI